MVHLHTQGVGRPRDPKLDIKITQAAIKLFRERGWGRTTIEEIALRAGVGKTTVYRRYPTKAALALDAWKGDRDVRFPNTDTGTAAGDLLAYTLGTAAMSSPGGPWQTILPALVSEMTVDTSIEEALAEVFTWRRSLIESIIERGQQRGEIKPDADAGRVHELVDGAILFRLLISRRPLDHRFASDLVDDVMDAIARVA